MSDLTKRLAALTPEKRKQLLRQLQMQKENGSKTSIPKRLRDGSPLPLSFAQERLWFLNQLEPLSAQYNIPMAFRLEGSLHLEALEHSLARVVQRHEVLRTSFSIQGRYPVQVIAPDFVIGVPVIDLYSLSATERDRQVKQLARADALHPFDLSSGPLLRVHLLRLDIGQEHVLLFTLHHIISDGEWSMGILVRELSLLYEAELQAKPAPLPALPLQYADYAIWQRQQLQGKVLEDLLAYWRQQLLLQADRGNEENQTSPPASPDVDNSNRTTPNTRNHRATPDGFAPGAPGRGPALSLQLPTDRPRQASQTDAGAMQSLLLSPILLQNLESLSHREGATLFMTLLAAFQVLLMRYSRQQDIVVGTPIANRGQTGKGQTPDLQDLIGFFVNTLVLRSDLSGNPSFQQLLVRVREVALQAYEHQDLPFEKLVASGISPDQRTLSHSPLFQVLFALQNVPRTDLKLAGLTFHQMEREHFTTLFDLSLIVTPEKRGLLTQIEYSTDLFDSTTIARLLSHWQVLLGAIVSDPDHQIGTLPLLTEAECEQVLEQGTGPTVHWNVTHRPVGVAPCADPVAGITEDFPSAQCLHQLFEQQASCMPDAVAVLFEEQCLTYAELNQRANQLAHALQRRGVGPERFVGVLMERSLWLVIALLGTLKAGGVYVPLDPTVPFKRLCLMIEEIEPVVLLCQILTSQTPEPLPCTQLLYLDTNWESIAPGPTDNLTCHITPEHLAYVIYTSGSTGQPKGVMIAHRAICNSLQWMQDTFRLTSTDSIMHKTPTIFDASLWELFWPFLGGARIVIARPEGHKDSTYVCALAAEQQVTTLFFVPSSLRAFLNEPDVEHTHNVRLLLCGGETLSSELQQRFLAQHPATLWNLYGPTEAAIQATAWHCARGEASASVPVGRPIANTQIYLLDAQGQLIPVGIPGEIYIGGTDLARGYLHQPDVTAERFLPNPFLGAGMCLYRTGDLARYRADGAIEYLGRIDQQVKLRGFRIELSEIEAVLSQHPDVRECVVVLREENRTRKYLVAYAAVGIVPCAAPVPTAPGQTQDPVPTASALQEYLHERLPDYMVPTSVVFLETLPLLPNGKVDRKALEQVVLPASEHQEATFVAPRLEVEKILATIWQQVLGGVANEQSQESSNPPQVGIHDNFFALGGDSILSMQIIARARQAGWHLTPRQIFQHQTIAQLARVAVRNGSPRRDRKGAIGTQTGASPMPFAPCPQAEEVIGPVPLTAIQHWFFEQDLPRPHHFNQAVLLQIPFVETGRAQGKEVVGTGQVPGIIPTAPGRLLTPTALIRQHLQQAVNTWVIQHDALRLRYERTVAGWQQRLVSVAEAGSVTVWHIDLTQVEALEQARIFEQIANHVQASLNLSLGPLMRVVLFDLGNGQPAQLLVVIHHLVVDGVSWRVLLGDLLVETNGVSHVDLPDAYLSGGPRAQATPIRTASFQSWAEYVLQMAQSVFHKDRAYWLKAALTPTVSLPVGYVWSGQVQANGGRGDTDKDKTLSLRVPAVPDHRLHDCGSEGCNMGAWARTVSIALTIEETRLLLQDALRPYRSHIQELLLVALLQTLARWMGTRQIRLDLEGHGREELGAETPDVSRTMGWFTSLYPVLFTLPQDGGIGIWIKTIKEQLRSVPHKGISYGLLRYLCDDTELREQLASAPLSQVVFNYLGQFAVGANVGGGSGEALGRQNPRNHIFDVNTLVIGGQLRLLWTYSERLHQQETVQALVQEFLRALRELLDHCLQPEAGSVTPSDFPLANLDQTTLERLLAVAPEGIEDIYPLTPLQQGLLFHTLSAPASGVYIEQVSCTLRGEVEVDTFEQAWLQVIRRHAILRTAFAWQGLSEPLQMVFKQVKLPLSILDWRGSPSQQQEADLEALLLADRVQGFDVGQAPLMRLTLVRLSEMRVQMIWTHHHLLLDGWSVSLVLQEVLACYEAEIQGESFVHEAPRPYRDYISWLTEQEDKAAEVYWRQTLAGIVAPTPLGVDRNVGKGRAQVVSNKPEPLNTSPVPIQEQKPGQSYAEEVLQVSEVITRKSQQYAREQRVTFNTLMQAAWALVLSRYSGQADVVFGITVSGRPPELAGMEQMIGLFINTVPVRVQLQGEEEMGVWLTRLQEQQLEQRSYEYSSLVQVQSWCRRHRSGAVGTQTGASPVPTAPVRVPTSPDGRSDPERIPHDQSLFESLLVFENYPAQAILAEQPSVSQSRRLGGLAFVEAVQVMEQTNYPLTIVVEPGVGRDKPQPLRLRVSYDRLRFERATIERMLGHLQTVLQQLVADPRKRLMEISLLTEAEHELVARGVVPRVAQGTRSIEWTNDPPPDLYVHQLFEQQVLHTPDAVALVFEEAALTYQELNDKANQLAHHLQAEGIGPDEPVGFYMERSPELVIAMLGILKAGGAYVPLDPSYPAERLTFILEETQPTLILTQAHLGSDLPSQWGYRDEVEGRQSPAGYTVCLVQYPTTDRRNEENLKPLSTVPGMGYSNRTFLGRLSGFALDTIWPDLTQEAHTNPVNPVSPDSLAYIIYTSGSTGKPKGAMITHQGLSNYVNFSRQHYRRDSARLLSEGCSSIVHSSLGFDLTITSLFVPLTSGGSVILLPEGQGIEGLVALLRCHQHLSFLKITPAHLELLNQMLPSEELDKVAYTLIIGGEALAASRVTNWWKFAPQTRLINEYGPTETVVGCSIYEVGTNDGNLWSDSTDSMDSLAQMVPIGYPIANTRLYILDAYGHPVPIGVVGELFIGGLGIARGYKNRPDLTAERFVPHPFVGGATGQAAVGVGAASFPCASPHPGERLYRSGDLARYLPDGTIEFLGRIDSQVKLRGYRIELGEIEATLHAHPVVQEAAVVLQEERTCSTEDRKYLVAYIVTRTGESFTTEAEPREAIIQAYLRERLPSYMVPTSIIELSSMPLTPNGKLDREALPAPKISTRHESFVAPHMPVEQTLAAIWRQVLGRELIGIHDNFFALGGDSILSMQIIRRAHLAGLYLTPKQLFQYQTIAQLATVAVPNAFPPDLLEFDVYTSPVVRRQESMAFLDPFEGTETKESTPTGPAEVFGPVPLTPIQHRFFEQEMPVPQHFNPAVMLQVPSNWNLRHLQQAVDTWLIHHDALRLRYERTVEGWQQRLVSVAEAGTVAVQRLDLTQVEASDLSSAIEQAANSLQASLDLTLGPLLRVVLFDLGDREPVLLLIVIHHLAVDGVSWRILLEGMQAVMARLSQEHPRDANSLQGSDTQIPTPVRTVSFQRWAEHLQELARSDLLLKERAYWLKTVQATNAPLPLDCDSQYQNTGAGIQEVSMTLTFEETRLLLQEAPRPYRCHIQELLLVALLQTLARWIGTETIRLDLYGHGREGLGDDVLDVSSTVGWFTSVYPVLFTLPRDSGGSQPLDRRETLPRWIKTIKEQLLTVPHKGIGYGLLRYLHADSELQAQLSSASPSQVSFNYLGQFDQVEWGISSREEVPQPVGPAQRLQSIGATHGPLNPRSYLLEINVLVLGGQLHLQWTYNKQLHHSTTIERLASEMGETLRELLVHCLGPEERDAHPGDLDLPPPIA